MRFIPLFIGLIGFMLLPGTAISQHNLNYNLYFEQIASSGVPFWLISNQYGAYSTKPFQSYGGLELKDTISLSGGYSITSGMEVRMGHQDIYHQSVRMDQVFVEFTTPLIKGYLGKRKYLPKTDFSIHSGNMLQSGNASSIPSIVLRTNGYQSVPFSKGYLAVKCLLAHRWLEEQRYTSDALVHQKYLYGKVGGDFPVNLYYGLHHIAQWGGNNPEEGQLPEKWRVFKQVVLAEQGNENTTSNPAERNNAIGNHIGSHHFGLIFPLGSHRMEAEWQSVFEDNSGKSRRNFPDGLWSITFNNGKDQPRVSSFTLQYLHTTNQSGPVHDVHDPSYRQVGGNDNYFNNPVMYQSGWTYRGFTIGNPFLTSPVFNIHHSLMEKDGEKIVRYMPNNKVVAWHGGIRGMLGEGLSYRLLVSWSKNYGVNEFSYYFDNNSQQLEDLREQYNTISYNEYGDVYHELPELKQFSSLVEFSFPLEFMGVPLRIQTRAALDAGKWLGNNWGFYVSITRHGNLRFE